MQFLKFWGEAIWASLSFGWVVFGIVSTAMPALFALVVRYWPSAANVSWIKWSAEHQSELHVGFAVIFIAIYLIYAPYRLYSREHTARIAAEQAKPVQAPTPIKLDVADEESRKEIIDLKKQLEASQETIRNLRQSPRSLTAQQRSKLVASLKPSGSFNIGIRVAETLEAQNYADQFIDVFKEVGWKQVNTRFLIHTRLPIGLWVYVPDGKNPTDGASQLLSALEAAGIPAKGMEVPALEAGTFELMVGYQEEPKPTPPSPTPDTVASPP